MMLNSEKLINEQSNKKATQTVLKNNIIKITRRIIRKMTSQNQKFAKAKAHLVDALKYKHPRYESQAIDTPTLFKVLYGLHINSAWEWLLYLFGYIFMFMVIADNQAYVVKIAIQSVILFTFLVDFCIIVYCKQRDVYENTSKYSTLTRAKFVLLLLMIIDLIIFIIFPGFNSRPIRPFRILRCFVPLMYDAEMRKTLKAFASAYIDSLVYMVFFGLVIVGYALIGSRSLTFDPSFKDPTVSQPFDFYKTNYNSLTQMIFMVYVTATYDSYPDNQLLAIQNSQWNYIYFILFIFLNMFVFSSIPGSLIFNQFKETRSKIILLDELRQQHNLILAFVTLAQNQKDLQIDKLIEFLLYLYRYKIRYIQYITDICLYLDDNNNRSIQVNQFMQISKVLLQNQAMLPPSFDDLKCWINFRNFMNRKFKLKEIVRNWKFQLVVSIIIILSFINALVLMYNYSDLVLLFDNIFIWIFTAQLIIRIVAIGPENLYMDKANYIDTFLVIFGIAFFFIPNQTSFEGIARIYRIFRLATLARLVSRKKVFKDIKFQISSKIFNIFSIMVEITPIILKFMPMFFFFFYIFGIIGMQMFYSFYTTNGSPAYNQYRQFSDFKSFIHTQYIMVQVLTEAGWSQIAFDHGWRAPQYAVYIMLYFILLHIVITYIIATLVKGIFWQVFFTVDSVFKDRNKEQQIQQKKQEQLKQKSLQIMQINMATQNDMYIEPNTILRRQIVEQKLNQKILYKLKNVFEKQIVENKRLKSKSSLVSHHMIDSWNIDIDSLNVSDQAKMQYRNRNNSNRPIRRESRLHEIQEMDKQDIQSQVSQILAKVILDPKIEYNPLVVTPTIFTQFLKSKFKHPQDLIDQTEFDLHLNPLYNKKSIQLHCYEIYALLGIQTSKREQKAMIIDSLIKNNIITEAKGEELVTKKLQQKIFHIDTNGALRKLYLSDVNEDLIKKFQIQYFSDLYGYSFKHINKMTLQPLLKFESTITYCLKNILRYPQIDNSQFFQMLTSIQDKFSNDLLQDGSLFKFIYKLNYTGDMWFSIEFKQQQQLKIHFIKTGIWCYHKGMKEKQISYARDVFNWDTASENNDQCHKYMKKFYQSFEGLAFSLLKEEKFFIHNPKTHVYDLYVQNFDVKTVPRYKTSKLQIKKIMVVILSKEQERTDIGLKPLQYELSDIIPRPDKYKKKQVNFKFQQSDSQSFQNLKNIAAKQSEKIVDSQGLPFAYMINLMKQIEDIMALYSHNFVYQIQKVLNTEYEQMKHMFGSEAFMISKGLNIKKQDGQKKIVI